MEGKRKVRLGKVINSKMNKTVVVGVQTPKRHRIYGKPIRRVVKYMADDEKSQCRVGDTVRIVETRPLSKCKHWRVAEIVIKGEVAEVKPTEIS